MHDNIPLGATGRFPEGRKIRDDDEGELRAAIGSDKGHVVIDFGTPVSWLSLTPDQARGLAMLIVRRAASIDGKPIVIQIGG